MLYKEMEASFKKKKL